MRSTKPAIRGLLIVLFVVAFAIVGCQKESVVNNVEPSTQLVPTSVQEQPIAMNVTVGSDSLLGQTIKLVLPGEGATLQVRTSTFTIQSGALRDSTLVTFSIWDATPPKGLKEAPKRVFKFFPEGLTFSNKSFLTVPFSELNLGRSDPRTLTCCYYNEQTTRYEPQPTTVDMRRKRFIVEINHFSQYAFGRVE